MTTPSLPSRPLSERLKAIASAIEEPTAGTIREAADRLEAYECLQKSTHENLTRLHERLRLCETVCRAADRICLECEIDPKDDETILKARILGERELRDAVAAWKSAEGGVPPEAGE